MLARIYYLGQNLRMYDRLRPTERANVFKPERRFEQITKLRKSLGLEPLDEYSFGQGVEVDRHATTIGIEIEMSWDQAFPQLGAEWQEKEQRPETLPRSSPAFKDFSRKYNKHDQKLRPLLREIEQVIPRVGVDAYWEFSFLPSKHIGVTLAELQTLYDAQILRDGVSYATHMTVAGIDNDRDAFAFLCGLEISGGSDDERILRAITSKKGSWARKGFSGLLKRRPEELMGTDTEGYEFRTLVASSMDQMTSLFLTARDLGEMYQQNPNEWKKYRAHIESILKEKGLDLSPWPAPRTNQVPWMTYANILSKKDV